MDPAPTTHSTAHEPDWQPAARALTDVVGAGRVRRNVKLAPYTTFRIGGPADLYVEAHTPDELSDLISVARDHGLPVFLLGLGANILVGDLGVRGLVVRNRACGIRRVQADRIRAESGATFYPDLIDFAVEAGLSGIEHYVGIPSTVGGAIWQNLHFLSPAPDRERTMFLAEVVESADLLTAEGDRRTVDTEYFQFGYDYSVLHERDDIVLEVQLRLQPGSRETMRRIIDENLAWRAARHPPLDTEPSAGSIFKKIEGIGAGRLIDRAGLKGTRIGQAEITHRHANIMVNRGSALAADIQALIQHVQAVVFEHSGYRLEPEIAFVGEFGPPTAQAPTRIPAP